MKQILELLDSSIYKDNLKGLRLLLKNKNIRNPELRCLLHNENHLVVGEFLLSYKYFTKYNISVIHAFILQNLANADMLFVSDLIDFAAEYQLSLPLYRCYSFLENYGGDNDYSQIAFLDYLLNSEFEMANKKIENLLIAIAENNCCSIYSQLRACLLLYSIGFKRQYILKIIAYTQIDDACKTLLRNIIRSNISNKKIRRSFYLIPNEVIKDKLTILYPNNKSFSCLKCSSLTFNSYATSQENS